MVPLKSQVLEESSILVKTSTGDTIKAKWVHGQLIPEETLAGQPQGKAEQIQELLGKVPESVLRNAAEYLEREAREANEQQSENGEQPPEPEPRKPISDSVFRQQLSSVMTDNKYDRLVKNRRRGRLDMTRLPKSQTGSQSVFAQKQARKNKHYSVVMLVDESGSMRDDYKIKTAAKVADFLAVHLDNLADLTVIGFNEYITPRKEFGAKVPPDLVQQIEGATFEDGAGNNNNYEALETAYRLLAGRDGTKLVIYLSDGDPATRPREDGCRICGRDKSHHDNFDNIRALVRSQSDIVTIGFGIKHEASDIPDNITIDNLEELKPRLLERLSKTIKRG